MRRTGVAVWHRDKGIYRLEVRICGNDYRGYICFCRGRDAEYTDRTARCGKVVRCKDCFYYEKYPAGDETILICGRTYAQAADGDYCSKGKRIMQKA